MSRALAQRLTRLEQQALHRTIWRNAAKVAADLGLSPGEVLAEAQALLRELDQTGQTVEDMLRAIEAPADLGSCPPTPDDTSTLVQSPLSVFR